MKTIVLITICVTGTFFATGLDAAQIDGEKTVLGGTAFVDNTAQVVDGPIQSETGGTNTYKNLIVQNDPNGAEIDGTNIEKNGLVDNTGTIQAAETGANIVGDASNQIAGVGGDNVATIDADKEEKKVAGGAGRLMSTDDRAMLKVAGPVDSSNTGTGNLGKDGLDGTSLLVAGADAPNAAI